MKKIILLSSLFLCIVGESQAQTSLSIEGKMNYSDRNALSKASFLESSLAGRLHLGQKRLCLFAEAYEWSARQEYMDYEAAEAGKSYARLDRHVYQLSAGVGLTVTEDAYIGVLLGYHSGTTALNNIVLVTGLQDLKWDIYSRFQVNTMDIGYTTYEAKVVPFISDHFGVGVSCSSYTGQGFVIEGKWGEFYPYGSCHFGFFDQNPSVAITIGLTCRWKFSSQGTEMAPFRHGDLNKIVQ